ncbi:hypothetical protein Droror1_Dr00022338 [Drosera rotundifolia]
MAGINPPSPPAPSLSPPRVGDKRGRAAIDLNLSPRKCDDGRGHGVGFGEGGCVLVNEDLYHAHGGAVGDWGGAVGFDCLLVMMQRQLGQVVVLHGVLP